MSSRSVVRRVQARGEEPFGTAAERRRMTSKGQVTIPDTLRRRYNITARTRLEFTPRAEGILVRPVREEGTFQELAGSASKHWTLDEMLRRLDELRREHA